MASPHCLPIHRKGALRTPSDSLSSFTRVAIRWINYAFGPVGGVLGTSGFGALGGLPGFSGGTVGISGASGFFAGVSGGAFGTSGFVGGGFWL